MSVELVSTAKCHVCVKPWVQSVPLSGTQKRLGGSTIELHGACNTHETPPKSSSSDSFALLRHRHHRFPALGWPKILAASRGPARGHRP